MPKVKDKQARLQGAINGAAISELVDGYFYNSWEIGALHTGTGADYASTTRVRTPYIFVKKGTRITFNEKNIMGGLFICIYTLNKTYKSGSGYFQEYFAEDDCYLRLTSRYLDDRTITDASAFNNIVKIEEKAAGVPLAKPYISGDFNKLFISDEWTRITGAAMTASTITDVYAGWETLRLANTGSITRTLLGKGGNASNVADAALDIYEYTISPSENGEGTVAKKLIPPYLVLITANMHGDEKTTTWQLLDFFTQMYAKLATDETMAALKSSVKFKIIPTVNPGGYNANTRNNLHGVNLNRNFDYLFSSATDADKGVAPYSELESMIVKNWLAANQDAIMYIDFHNMSIDDENLSYINSPNRDILRVYSSVIRRMSDVWKRRGISYSANVAYGFLANDQWPMACQDAYFNHGITYSTILEIIHTYGTQYSADVLRMGTELFGNFLFSMLDFISR
jgi:hypothetical protein